MLVLSLILLFFLGKYIWIWHLHLDIKLYVLKELYYIVCLNMPSAVAVWQQSRPPGSITVPGLEGMGLHLISCKPQRNWHSLTGFRAVIISETCYQSHFNQKKAPRTLHINFYMPSAVNFWSWCENIGILFFFLFFSSRATSWVSMLQLLANICLEHLPSRGRWQMTHRYMDWHYKQRRV